MAIRAKSVDVSKLKFSAPKTLGNQSRSVYVNYEGDKLRIQTPIMHLPYGVSDNEALAKLNKKPGDTSTDVAQPKKYDLSVSFRGMDGNKGLQTLHDKMREIENAVIDHVFENRQVLLRDDYEGVKKFVAKLFTPIVKYDKDKDTGVIHEKGMVRLGALASRYVSFMRGEDPRSFPIRLDPEGIDHLNSYPSANPRGTSLKGKSLVFKDHLPLVPIELEGDALEASQALLDELKEGDGGISSRRIRMLARRKEQSDAAVAKLAGHSQR
jgi:hypothetical protein